MTNALALKVEKNYVVEHLLTDMEGNPFAHLAMVQKPTEPTTIAEFLERYAWDKNGLPTICVINGQPVSRSLWNVRLVGENDNVQFWSRPGNMGGAGAGGKSSAKSLIPVIALVAFTVLLPMLAPTIGAAIGVSAAAVKTFATILLAGGSLLLSFFNKPKKGAKDTGEKDELYSITADGNQARPMQPIPVGYGRRINSPDFASQAYTEFRGDDQILYELLCVGAGSYEIEKILMDDTPIWTKAGGVDSDFAGKIAIQIVNPGEKVTLFPVNVVTAAEVSSIELKTTDWVGGYVVNAAGTQATKVVFDIIFPNGLYNMYKGDRLMQWGLHLQYQYREVDAAGAPIGTWADFDTKLYMYAKKTPIRISEDFDLPKKGRFEVRMRRQDPLLTDQEMFDGKAQIVNDCTWAAVRAYIDGPKSFPDVTLIALRVKADQTISGMSSRRIQTVQTRKLNVWDGNTWTLQKTRNPVWAALDIWSNTVYSAGLPLSQVDLATFLSYAQFYDANNICFDHFFTSATSIYDALETALKAGRAHPAFVGDRLTMIRDQPRGLPRQLFTDREIVRGSFQIHRRFTDEEFADGVVIEYLDQTTWQLAEVSSADNLQKPANIQVDGVVQREQAFDLACYYAASNAYRRRTATFSVELEGRMLKRGDLISIQSNVPRTWGTSAYVVSYDPALKRLTLADDMPWSSNTADFHYVEIRRKDGRPFGPVKVTKPVPASPNIVAFDSVDLAKVEGEQFITVAEVLDRTDTMDEVSVVFAAQQPRTFKGLVTKGTPSGNYMEIECVYDDARVYVAADGKPVPALPEPDGIFQIPAVAPTITGFAAHMQQLGANVYLNCGWDKAARAVDYVVQGSYDGQTWFKIYQDDENSFERVVPSPANMYVRIAGRTANNLLGAWYQVYVTAPTVVLTNDHITMRWDENDLKPQARRMLEFQPQFTLPADVTATAVLQARVASDKGDAAISQVTQLKADTDASFASLQTTVQTNYDNATAYADQQISALSEPGGAIANVQTNLNALTEPGGAVASLQEDMTVVNNKFDGMAASYTMKLDLNGYVTGMQLVAERGTPSSVPVSEMRVLADKFLVGGGGAPGNYVFGVITEGGVARVAINGNLIATGTISSNRLEATTLSAINANLGQVRAGNMYSYDGRTYFDLDARRLEFWD